MSRPRRMPQALLAGAVRVLRLAAVAVGVVLSAAAADAPRPIPPLSGASFQSAETQAQEKDLAANPGMLWVERGAT